MREKKRSDWTRLILIGLEWSKGQLGILSIIYRGLHAGIGQRPLWWSSFRGGQAR